MDKLPGAGKILGPRPGKAICSFWQGTLEIVLWLVAAVFGSLPALVAAAIALGSLDTTSTLQTELQAAAGYAIGITGLSIILLVVFIILRICNIGLLNVGIKFFLAVVIIINVVLLLGHLAGGVVTAYYGNESGIGERVGNALVSSAAFCFLGAVLLSIAVIWDIMYLAKSWNKKVLKYTLKNAVLG